MRRPKVTLAEAIIALAAAGITAAIVLPALRRPARFHAAVIPAQSFARAPLQSVVAQLDASLQDSRAQQGQKPVRYLKRIVWQSESLKSRRVTLRTSSPASLRDVLSQLEKSARVKVSFGPGCGTCGSFDGPTTISDAAAPG